jgi:hypothetical protein
MIHAFVSSTYVDLKEHRACVIDRLTAGGIFVDPMEKWTASSNEPKELFMTRVKDCLLRILLVGFRRFMKTKFATVFSWGILLGLLAEVSCQAQPTLGIPEPGLLMYGSVTNAAGGLPLPPTAITWQISSGSDLATVPGTIVVVNGQCFHVARVPFETRSAGSMSFVRTPNVLGLTKTASTFGRAVRVNGTNATIVSSSRAALATFTFSAADRGLAERVDLQINLPGQPAPDTDGDGIPDWAEVIAGTNPADPNSVFKASADVQPALGGGLIIRWSSVAGKTYSLHRTTDLAVPFTAVGTNVPASPPQNQFTDATATGPGPFFYRVQVVE